MNKPKFKRNALLSMFAIFALSLTSCDDDGSPPENTVGVGDGTPIVEPPNEEHSLVGTSWKLVGIVDETEVLQELEPKDCEGCYTLSFNPDVALGIDPNDGAEYNLTAFSSSNTIFGTYNADYETKSINIALGITSEVGETGDGHLWGGFVSASEYFSFHGNELRLYYNNNKNYLLFEPQ